MSSESAEFFRRTKQFEKAKHWLATMRQAYGTDDPFAAFLTGTVAFDAGDLDEAFGAFDSLYGKYTARPYKEKDPKYLAFYRARAQKRR